MQDRFEELARDGYTWVPRVFSATEILAARQACAEFLANENAASSVLAGSDRAVYGARNLLRLWPTVIEFIRHPGLAASVLSILGPHAGVVRGLYFDKPPGNSWALPWHRDLTVAVKEHGHMGQFRKPTNKAGVPHLEAPADLLASMVTVRIHLDAVTDANGPLRVVPGSHLLDRTSQAVGCEPVVLKCDAGDVLLMRPLLLHASGHSQPGHEEHRRIIHLELASSPALPDGYEWHDFVAIAGTHDALR